MVPVVIVILITAMGCKDSVEDTAAEEPTANGNAANPQPESSESADSPAEDSVAVPTSDKTTHYGEPFTIEGEATPLAEAIKTLTEGQNETIKIAAIVKTSCRKKGCWMQLEPVGDAEPIRVTFKDYGFFVPKHADGMAAVAEGIFEKETVTEGMRRHFAEDAGKSATEIAAIEGDVEVIKFVATAVDLTTTDTSQNL